jgi:hypothetical protein
METHVTGQPVLGELRQHVLAALLGNLLFSEAEQLRANHFVHESEDIGRLTRWGANVLAEITRREAAAACLRRHRATCDTLRCLPYFSFRGHCSRKCKAKPAWVPGTFFPDRADRWASTFDRLAARQFQAANSLTFAALLNCSRR